MTALAKRGLAAMIASGGLAPRGLDAATTLALLRAPQARRPRRARCLPCGHVWTVAFEPMAEDRLARCLARATCPACGEIDLVCDAADAGGLFGAR
jgi:hypothetical protein